MTNSNSGYIKTIISLSFLLLFINFPIEAQNQTKYRIRKVVIDPGHGGIDPGAVGKKSYEKNIALSIALKFGQMIEKNFKDIKVIYTRTTDKFVELHQRAAIANSNKADLFISIHVNSNRNSRPFGTSTYVMGLNKSVENLEVALQENSAILNENDYKKKYEGYDPNSPETYIILNLMQNAFLEQSVILASKVQEQFKTFANRKDLGVRQAGLLVLWNATMPSILIETGFISNAKEEKYLMKDENQNLLALSIFKAFKIYKTEIERKSNQTDNSKDNKKKDELPSSKISYKLQIKTSTKSIPLNSKIFKGIDNIEESNEKGSYKYYVGETESYKEILKKQKEIKKKIPDAFVVAFKDGNKISLKEANIKE